MSTEPTAKRSLSASPPPPRKEPKLEISSAAAQPAPAAPATGDVADTPQSKTQVTASKQNRQQQGKNRKGKRAGKVKAVKPGGAEEAGAFDVIALLGQDRVAELEESDRDWKKESEAEWGWGADGKDIEVKIVELNSHGERSS